MIAQPSSRECPTSYGGYHSWVLTARRRPGQFRCTSCGVPAFCPGCVLLVPPGVIRFSCSEHRSSAVQQKEVR